MSATCKECRYFQPRNARLVNQVPDTYGTCRRRAPVWNTSGSKLKWPGVRDNEWCGELVQLGPSESGVYR